MFSITPRLAGLVVASAVALAAPAAFAAPAANPHAKATHTKPAQNVKANRAGVVAARGGSSTSKTVTANPSRVEGWYLVGCMNRTIPGSAGCAP